MSPPIGEFVPEVCAKYANDPSRMMDIVRDIQEKLKHVPGEAMDIIAAKCQTHRVEVESVVSFYSFYHAHPKGHIVIRICNDVTDMLRGAGTIAAVFEEELGIKMGETTADGNITLGWTPCIGMSDQAPAALINDLIVTYLSTDKARRICQRLKEGVPLDRLVRSYGDGSNAHPLVRSRVVNNIRRAGKVDLAESEGDVGLEKAVAMSPQEIVRLVKNARLRGRGGAGFPTGLKWEFTRQADSTDRVLICNADEGEPGTFKDRVILTERPNRLFEGMTIAAYAIGATTGLVYVRAEYAYLRQYLEEILRQRREDGLLGENICGKEGLNFDIRIQMGACAYVCGEETALISSCEGLRGDPKNRPPFPAQKGYMGRPTCVNNVETLSCVPGIVEHGSGWFASIGTQPSTGTKLLSISGDCPMRGVYEFDFGITLREVLNAVGAPEAKAVQVGGPSGQMVGEADFDRQICFDDLAMNGSVVVFGPDRDLLDAARQYMDFFNHENCGYCTPCRVGNKLLRERLQLILDGRGRPEDLDYLEELGETVKTASRCGLGQTSPNPILTTLKNFREEYEKRLIPTDERAHGFLPTFDITAALATGEEIAGRKSVVFTDE